MITLVAPHSGSRWGRRSCGRRRIGFARARDQRESEDRKCRKKNDQARTFHRFWPVEVHKLSLSIETSCRQLNRVSSHRKGNAVVTFCRESSSPPDGAPQPQVSKRRSDRVMSVPT